MLANKFCFTESEKQNYVQVTHQYESILRLHTQCDGMPSLRSTVMGLDKVCKWRSTEHYIPKIGHHLSICFIVTTGTPCRHKQCVLYGC